MLRLLDSGTCGLSGGFIIVLSQKKKRCAIECNGIVSWSASKGETVVVRLLGSALDSVGVVGGEKNNKRAMENK